VLLFREEVTVMSRSAWFYIWSVLILGTLIGGFAFIGRSINIEQWVTFGALTLFATLSQFLEAEAPGRQYYYPHMIFFFAGALLLDPFLFALLILIPHLIEWAKERIVDSAHLRAWYIQPFNISVHLIAGLTSYWLFGVLGSLSTSYQTPRSVVAVTLAALGYVTLNHIMVGLALVLARGISWSESGVLEFENLLTDFIMIYLGYIVAVLWRINPFLLIPALSPLVLMYRALMIPELKQQAQTDSKTGLLNARHFAKVFEEELERARRTHQPLAVIMADLDLLRTINNTYGHLAGDVVLAGIGETIRKTLRSNDIAGRFGGEEFTIILPELGPAEAYALAERIRQTIEAMSFDVATSSIPIQATMSLGIACFPADGDNTTSLTQAADVAVYQAKLNGRNRVVMAADVPHSIKLDASAQMDQVSVPHESDVTYHIPILSQVSHSPTAAQTTAKCPVAPSTIDTERPLLSQAAEPKLSQISLLISSVVAVAIGMATLGFQNQLTLDLTALVMFAILAMSAELLQIDLYGTGTVSVSVGIAFAAALVSGIPGVVVVSAAIAVGAAIARSFRQQRPCWYKIAYNWGAHVLAGAVPALAITLLDLRLDTSNLAVLLLPLALAAVAYYLIDTGLIAAAISLSTRATFASIWRQQFHWLVSHYFTLCMIGVFLAIAYTTLGWSSMLIFTLPMIMMRYAQQQYVARTEDSVRELKRLNQELASANHEVSDASRAIQQLNDELFLTLSKIIDARDPYVSGHAAKVADYATSIAAELGLPAERIVPIRQAGLLHDIGKIGVSEHILHKPSKLTPEEYEQVKTHANLGAEFLETARGLRHLVPFVRHHHERWDGRGYPQGLVGEQTPLEARILAVCDAVEAMASDRPYQRAMSLEEIIIELRRGRGTHFDPALTDVFIRIAEREGAHLLVNSAEQVMRRQANAQFELAQAVQLLQFRKEHV
jgi:diguanylate cyclase (GGDEF)-like protein/putative nucleotidyltransferase with HDIG domain